MAFIIALFNKECEELAYKSYVADALQILSENTGRKINDRYIEVLEKLHKPKDNRSGIEIAEDVIKKAGLVVIDE